MKKQVTGWMQADQRKRAGLPVDPDKLSDWEKLLLDLGLHEEEVVSVLREENHVALRLRMFAKKNLYRRYVPEDVLKAMGLKINVDRNFSYADAVLAP